MFFKKLLEILKEIKEKLKEFRKERERRKYVKYYVKYLEYIRLGRTKKQRLLEDLMSISTYPQGPSVTSLNIDLHEVFKEEVLQAVDKGRKAEEIFPEIEEDLNFFNFIAEKMMKMVKEIRMDETFQNKLKEWFKIIAYFVAKSVRLYDRE